MAAMGQPKIGWHGVRKRDNDRYQARWCNSEGLQSEGGFISRQQAATYALKMANEALNVKVGLAVMRKPIADARQQFLERRTKENTRALNTRRIDEFLTAMPEVKDTSHLTRNLIDRYALALERAGHNPGGQGHHLRIVRAFCRFCYDNEWIAKYPFKGFTLPSSEFEGRELTADEWAAMVSISPGALNQYPDVDKWLNLAFRFGHSTFLRISQVWKLTPADFVEPDQLRVLPIKGQDPVWITLHDDAAAILRVLAGALGGRDRFFWYWGSVESMRNSVEDKARRAGLGRLYAEDGSVAREGVRFHDVCKVTRISQLTREGWSLGDLANLSNTSKKTLVAHYIKADRTRSFEKYKSHVSPAPIPTFDLSVSDLGQPRANGGPSEGGFVPQTAAHTALDGAIRKDENESTSQPVPAL